MSLDRPRALALRPLTLALTLAVALHAPRAQALTLTAPATLDTGTPTASGPSLQLAFNNTPACAHNAAGEVTVVYVDRQVTGSVFVMTDACAGGGWCSSSLPTQVANSQAKFPTLVSGKVDPDRMLMAWTEVNGSDSRVVAAHSADGGTTWTSTVIASYTGVAANHVSADVFATVNQDRAAACWEVQTSFSDDDAPSDVECAIWEGTDWISDIADWSASAPTPVSTTNAARNPTVAGHGVRAVVAWDEGQSSVHRSRWSVMSGWSSLGWWVNGNDPSLAYATDGTLFFGHQLSLTLYTSTDHGTSMAGSYVLGGGVFAHMTPTPSGNDLLFTYEPAYQSTSQIDHYDYDSATTTFTQLDAQFLGSEVQPSACVRETAGGVVVDVFTIDPATAELLHRQGS